MKSCLDSKQPVLDWLLAPDPDNPAIRYLALRDLLNLPDQDSTVRKARRQIMRSGPVPVILDAQQSDGHWGNASREHWPTMQDTPWQICLLSELGADPRDGRVRAGCRFFLDHFLVDGGGVGMTQAPSPSKVVHCHNANAVRALLLLGFQADPRVRAALAWQEAAIVGAADVTFYKSGTAGPGFACSYNAGLPCAWGAVKALRMLTVLPTAMRTRRTRAAIEQSATFLLSHNLAKADYPHARQVSGNWLKFGFPLTFTSDILEVLLTLAEAGHGHDARLDDAYDYVTSKQDALGRWKLERSLAGKGLVNIETPGKPSKWLTLRALRALRARD